MCTFSWHKEANIIIMDRKLLVDTITTETADWTSKVQVVYKFRPRESSDSSIHFQTILVQDEKVSLSLPLPSLENGVHTLNIIIYGNVINYTTFVTAAKAITM